VTALVRSRTDAAPYPASAVIDYLDTAREPQAV
jgi:hypothetical protein